MTSQGAAFTAVDNSNSGSRQVVGQPGPFQGILLALPCNNLQYWKFINLTQRDKPGALKIYWQQKNHGEENGGTSKK